jgi:hypothetical protein
VLEFRDCISSRLGCIWGATGTAGPGGVAKVKGVTSVETRLGLLHTRNGRNEI